MRRFHLLELEDQSWCPQFLRNGMTDYLQWLEQTGQMYRPLAARMRRVLEKLAPARIVDLCSGGGGPCVNLMQSIDGLQPGGPEICLTDLYPNLESFDKLRSQHLDRISFSADPIDATNVPPHLTGFRTLFTAFHHFPPGIAQAVLRDAVEKRQGIGVFEYTRRNLLNIIAMSICAPILMVLCTPFVKPFRMSRLFWTYVIPLLPAAITYDGVVSCLRTYTPQELTAMVSGIDGAEAYVWDIGIERSGNPFHRITYLIGYHPSAISDPASA